MPPVSSRPSVGGSKPISPFGPPAGRPPRVYAVLTANLGAAGVRRAAAPVEAAA
jgi:hypothetical protein